MSSNDSIIYLMCEYAYSNCVFINSQVILIGMITYVKIYGPPALRTVRALEKIALDMPQVCIMDMPLLMTMREVGNQTTDANWPISLKAIRDFFGVDDLAQERCETIISKSSRSLGEYDFFFEWLETPTSDQYYDLIEKIDEAVKPIGSRYTVITK